MCEHFSINTRTGFLAHTLVRTFQSINNRGKRASGLQQRCFKCWLGRGKRWSIRTLIIKTKAPKAPLRTNKQARIFQNNTCTGRSRKQRFILNKGFFKQRVFLVSHSSAEIEGTWFFKQRVFLNKGFFKQRVLCTEFANFCFKILKIPLNFSLARFARHFEGTLIFKQMVFFKQRFFKQRVLCTAFANFCFKILKYPSIFLGALRAPFRGYPDF